MMKRSDLILFLPKRQFVLLVCFILVSLLLVACAELESTLTFEVVSPDAGQNETIVDASEVVASEIARSHELGYAFASHGTRIRPTKPAEELGDFLAQATRMEAIQHASFGTAGKRYVFADCTIDTVFFNEVEFIERIIVTDPAVQTPEGISVGMTRADVIRRLGDQYSEEDETIIYEDASVQFVLEFAENDDLATISYVGKFVG